MIEFITGLIGLSIFFWLIALMLFILWIWMLIDSITREFPNPSDKAVWIALLIISFFFGLGGLSALVYFVAVFLRYKRTLPESKIKITEREKLLRK